MCQKWSAQGTLCSWILRMMTTRWCQLLCVQYINSVTTNIFCVEKWGCQPRGESVCCPGSYCVYVCLVSDPAKRSLWCPSVWINTLPNGKGLDKRFEGVLLLFLLCLLPPTNLSFKSSFLFFLLVTNTSGCCWGCFPGVLDSNETLTRCEQSPFAWLLFQSFSLSNPLCPDNSRVFTQSSPSQTSSYWGGLKSLCPPFNTKPQHWNINDG